MKRVNVEGKYAEGLPLTDKKGKAPRRARKFAQDQDGGVGGLGWLSLTMFFFMVLMGGLAVDLMRYEYTRTSLQQTADTSALAAAAWSQKLEAEDVVEDYFDKDNKLQYLTKVYPESALNYTRVTVEAERVQPTFFMRMMGYDTLDVPAASVAEQRITNVEIAMVLDVSGSMAGTKIANLKTAAKQFVSDVLSKDTESRVSVAIVPYNGQINLNSDLFAKYTVKANSDGTSGANGTTNSNCFDLPSSVFSSASLSTGTGLPQTAYADTYSSTSQSTSFVAATDTSSATPASANYWCPAIAGNQVRLPNNSITTMQSQIDGLSAIGATSINAGIKWGLALLDPGSRTMFTQLLNAGKIPAAFTGRPFDYDDPEAMKVIVLMTDGENFAEERMNDGYRGSQLSPIYKSTKSGTTYYSIYHSSKSGTSKYWRPDTGTWVAAAYNAGTTPTQMKWQEVWTSMRTSYVAWQFYARALGTSSSTRTSYYNSQMAAFRTQTDTTAMDTQLQSICTLAKGKNVIIFGIAFEAPTNGQTQIAKCAQSLIEKASDTANGTDTSKSSANYFQSTNGTISSDFKTIASNISQLRLTQ
ncbi:MAG: vWA domain-containing protein [Paracoccaceae bacterium]